MSTRIHTFLLKGSPDDGDGLGFVVTEGGSATMIHPDSAYGPVEHRMEYGDVESLHRFLGEILDVMDPTP